MRTKTPGCVPKSALCPALLAGVAAMVASHAQTPEWIWQSPGTKVAAAEEIAFFRKTFRTPPYLWNSRLTTPIQLKTRPLVFRGG